jgi:nucleotide-binding universal stress UspA family protein
MAALDAAAELAANLGAELLGIFVEDINLIRLGGLPPVQEVGRSTGRSRELDDRRISHELRGQAARARRAMQQIGIRLGLQWSFRVSRGSIDAELLQAATSADLVILGKAGWSGSHRLGSTAEAVLSAGPRPTLVVEAKDRLQPTLMAVYDGSEVSRRALDTAIDLAEKQSGYLAVGIVAEDTDRARALQREVFELLRDSDIEVPRFRWLVEVDSAALGEMIRTQEQCILVIPGESPLLAGKSLQQALADFDCPVLVVR